MFGVRTTDGRYAKLRAWRAGGALQLSWVTYDTPVPQLDIAARWSVLERGEVTEFIGRMPDLPFQPCSVARRVRSLAPTHDLPSRLPMVPLRQGAGRGRKQRGLAPRTACLQSHGPSFVDRHRNGAERRLRTVRERDRRPGQELFTCIQLSQPGIETRCRRCVPKATNLRIEIIPAEPLLGAWRPLITGKP